MAPRIISPVVGTVDVRIYSDECAAAGGKPGDFPVTITGQADAALAKWLKNANEIDGFEMLEMVAAVVPPGGQFRGTRLIWFLGNLAAGGALIIVSLIVPVVPSMVGSFWGTSTALGILLD